MTEVTASPGVATAEFPPPVPSRTPQLLRRLQVAVALAVLIAGAVSVWVISDLRNDLAALLTGLDDYVEVVDPLTTTEIGSSQVSGDIADVAAALVHGLRHYADGELSEALWWWQFSYLSSWGARAGSALRVLQSVISHIRLDADEDVVAVAQFDALHGA